MTFVRFAGCSVRHCTIRAECDEAPWRVEDRLSLAAVIDRVRGIQRGGIVCLTGGEPTDQDVLPIVAALRDDGYRVHMETSGIRSVAGWPLEWLTVSPKTSNYVQRAGHVLKVVVRPEWGWDEVDYIDQDTQFFHRYLQPLTVDGAPVNLRAVIDLVSARRNTDGRWALSWQAHRAWDVQ